MSGNFSSLLSGGFFTGSVSRSQAGQFIQAPIASQEWFGTPLYFSALSAVSSNVLYTTPWIAPETCVIDQIAIRVSTGAAGNAKFGLYNASGNLPSSLGSENTADLSTAGSGIVAGALAAPVSVIAGNLYWPSVVFSGTPTCVCYNNTGIQVGGYHYPVGSLRNTANSWFVGGSFFVSQTLTYVPGPTPFFPASFGTPSITNPIALAFALRKQ